MFPLVTAATGTQIKKGGVFFTNQTTTFSIIYTGLTFINFCLLKENTLKNNKN